jgi:lysophospholipase
MNKLILALFIILSFLRCGTNTKEEFPNVQSEKYSEELVAFINKNPDSPQILFAKLELERIETNSPENFKYNWSSETNIDISEKDKRFIDNKTQLKQILDFYKTKSQREFFTGADGAKIVYDYFPVENATDALIISHGSGESSIRYAEVVYDLLNNNFPYSIFVINHRGHGYSDRLLGKNKNWDPTWNVYDVYQKDILEYRKIYVNDFDDFIKDFSMLVDIIKSKYKVNKISAMGHSLGGAIVTRYAELNPNSLEKIALSAPMHSIIGLLGADNSDYLSKAIISTFDTFSHKNFAIGGGGESFNHFDTKYITPENNLNYYTTSKNRLSMKKYILQEYPDTSLGSFTWGFVDSIYEGVKVIRRDANKIQIPTLILQAEYDDFVHPIGQAQVCDAINKNKQDLCKIILIKSAKHELLLERDSIRGKVLDIFFDFLVK